MSLFLLALAAQAAAPQPVLPGRETVIQFATGNLQNWEVDKVDPNILYVRDRRRGWYRVELTGDCPTRRNFDLLRYSVDANDRFDTFSRVSFGGNPQVVCGIRSIRTSVAPPTQPPERVPAR